MKDVEKLKFPDADEEHRGDEPQALDDEDEKILDAIWAQIGRERETA